MDELHPSKRSLADQQDGNVAFPRLAKITIFSFEGGTKVNVLSLNLNSSFKQCLGDLLILWNDQ